MFLRRKVCPLAGLIWLYPRREVEGLIKLYRDGALVAMLDVCHPASLMLGEFTTV
jgi:hypothetical protein